jgi:hypothetical protein
MEEELKEKIAELELNIKALLDCREWTERTHQDAYDFTFKSGPHRTAWENLARLTNWVATPEEKIEDGWY